MLAELFHDLNRDHSEYRMDFHILARSSATHYGRFMQSLLELHDRTRGLIDLYLTRVEVGNENASSDVAEIRRQFRLSELDRQIASQEREFARFLGLALALKQILGPLTPERHAELDRERWEEDLKRQAVLDMMATGNVSKNVLALIAAAPLEMRGRMCRFLFQNKDRAPLFDWYISCDIDIPEPVHVDPAEVPGLIACYESSGSLRRLLALPATDAAPLRLISTGDASKSASPAASGSVTIAASAAVA